MKMAGTLSEEQLAKHVYTALQVEEISKKEISNSMSSLTIKIMPYQLKLNNVFTHSPVASHFSVDTSKLQLVVLNLQSKSELTISAVMSHTKSRLTRESKTVSESSTKHIVSMFESSLSFSCGATPLSDAGFIVTDRGRHT